MNNGKTLVLYVFHVYNNRVEHFIHNCIFKDPNVDFIIISNGKNNVFQCQEYVMTLFRDNIGYDFGGWSEALLKNNLYKNYDKFIFVNSSVVGPFLPNDFQGKWTDIYTNGLQNNVKLFGSTINTCEYPLTHSHVQSYIFSTDLEALQYLIDCNIFSITNHAQTFLNAVWGKEVEMSRLILKKGWNIGSLLKYYDNIDFRFQDKKPKDYHITFLNDVMFDKYKNKMWTKYDLVFVKGNRVNI